MGVIGWVLILAASVVFAVVTSVLIRSLSTKGERNGVSND